MKRRLVTGALALSCLAAATPCAAQGLAEDPFASHITGEWTGIGVYDGNELSLTRSWTLELGDQFLRADMGVAMPNGATFGAVTYWKPTGEGGYEVIWMDATGRMQTFSATRDPASGVVRSDFVDNLVEGGAEPRRWEFEAIGSDAYVERLFRRNRNILELLPEWTFRRAVPRS
jgi:hypothetical protein